MSPMIWSRKHRTTVFILLGFAFFSYYSYLYCPETGIRKSRHIKSFPLCPKSALANDTLVVIRTGATEALEKLPVHFETVLKCVPDFVLYSDYEEEIEGYHLLNVLDDVNASIKATAPEFKFYNELHKIGRAGLKYQTTFGSGPSGALDNPGWKLDKWKFLPMVDRALRHRVDAKWFVFVEGDTYMMWQNVLAYLANFDPSKEYYIGKHMYIHNVLFGHGGSGFMLSRPAAEKVATHWREHQEAYDQYTLDEWAGDMILGKVLMDVGISMFWAFPHLQGDSLISLDWNVSKLDREPWCYAPLTFHHMSPNEYREIWKFEQDWLGNTGNLAAPSFRNIFMALVQPKLRGRVDDWDNMSTGKEYTQKSLSLMSEGEKNGLSQAESEAHMSFEHCQAVCESRLSCIQFSYIAEACRISDELRLGYSKDSQCSVYSTAAGRCVESAAKPEGKNKKEKYLASSGWIMSRVRNYVSDLNQSCGSGGEVSWVT